MSLHKKRSKATYACNVNALYIDKGSPFINQGKSLHMTGSVPMCKPSTSGVILKLIWHFMTWKKEKHVGSALHQSLHQGIEEGIKVRSTVYPSPQSVGGKA